VSKTPLVGIFNLIGYRLHTGCQWDCLPVSKDAQEREARNEPSWQAVYDHWRQWSADGSLERVWQYRIVTIQDDLDLQPMNLDGSHAIAKKGGESVAYQARKRAKTSHILPITDRHGYIIASTGIVAGNPNDAFNLKTYLQQAFKAMKGLGLLIAGALFNADSAFDTKQARKVCFNHQHYVCSLSEAAWRHGVFCGTREVENCLEPWRTPCHCRLCAWTGNYANTSSILWSVSAFHNGGTLSPCCWG
jgi:hypothetical protein